MTHELTKNTIEAEASHCMSATLEPARDIVAFLNVSKLAFDDVEVTLAARLAGLLGQDVTLFFECPLISSGEKPLYLAFDSATSSANISSELPESPADSDDVISSKIVHFGDFEEEDLFQPNIVVKFSEPVSQDDGAILETLITEFVSSALRRQFALMRRTIINAKIDSDDLGSFLHRLFNRQKFHRLLSAEAASIFVLNHHSTMLHLRGTTGLKADTPMADINFHVDEALNVPEVFRNKKPKIAFDGGKRLSLGRSAEATDADQYTKAYWPLQVRERSSPKARLRAPRPCVGVVRIVNHTNPQIENAPHTWLPITCLVYAAESLYNDIEAFVAKDEASFNKDAAFHGSMSIVDTIVKNVDIVRRSIFDGILPPTADMVPIFYLNPRTQVDLQARANSLRTILNTAYASARSLGFQIERAGLGLPIDSGESTDRLITDVLVRALELIGDMCISHSATERVIRPSVKDLLDTEERPPPVRGSPEALTSVFANLCENSVKYRKPGEPIKLEIGFKIGNNNVEVRFRDYGIGILAGEEERIFARGYRTERARQYAVRGGGLGLNWCREVLEHFGGSIKAFRKKDGLDLVVTLSRKVHSYDR